MLGFIRKGKVTDGARYNGRMLRDVVTNDNTASDVWADTAYRSQSHERWLKAQGRVEPMFAHQKAAMGLFVRTIGIARAEAKITLANLAYNMHRLIFHDTRDTNGNGITASSLTRKSRKCSKIEGPKPSNTAAAILMTTSRSNHQVNGGAQVESSPLWLAAQRDFRGSNHLIASICK